MFKATTVAFCAVLTLLVGCGKESSTKDTRTLQVLNGAEYVVLPGGNLQSEAGSVKGTGKIVFRKPLVDGSNNYALTFSLGQEGTLCLVSQADGNLQDGVSFCFSRTATDGLKAQLKVGDSVQDKSADFSSVVASNALSFSIDIHGNGHGHLIIWNGDDEYEYQFSNRNGTLWGIELQNSTLTSAVQGVPRENH